MPVDVSPTVATRRVPTESVSAVELRVRLRKSAAKRLAALNAGRPKKAARAYATDSDIRAWTSDLFRLDGRGVLNVWAPFSMVAVVTIAWTPIVMHLFDADSETCSALSNAEGAFRLQLTALSFLLVFRLNRAATRHWEARQLCGWMMIHCRDLAMSSVAAHASAPGDFTAETRDRLCEVAVGFPVAFMLHVWGPAQSARRAALFESMCCDVFDAPTMELFSSAAHRPLAMVEHAQAVLASQFLSGSARDNLAMAQLYASLLHSAKGLGQPLGGCERIQGTPLPHAFVVHLRSFLLLVLCGIPVVYACDWRWATIPLSLLVAFGLLGIEAASVECERPFSPTPTKNDHDVEKFCGVLSREVTEMLERAAASAEAARGST